MMKNYEPPFEVTTNIIKLLSSIIEEIGKIHFYKSLDKYQD